MGITRLVVQAAVEKYLRRSLAFMFFRPTHAVDCQLSSVSTRCRFRLSALSYGQNITRGAVGVGVKVK